MDSQPQLYPFEFRKKRRYPHLICSDRGTAVGWSRSNFSQLSYDCVDHGKYYGKLAERLREDVDGGLSTHAYKQASVANRVGGTMKANISVQTLVATLDEINDHLRSLRKRLESEPTSKYRKEFQDVDQEVQFLGKLVENVRIEDPEDGFSEEDASTGDTYSDESEFLVMNEDTPLMLGAVSFYEEEKPRTRTEYSRARLTNGNISMSDNWNYNSPLKLPYLASVSSPSRPLRIKENPHIYVDASGKGIGITISHRMKWLAWAFKEQSPSCRVQVDNLHNKYNNMDICWAELVAVELGLRTAAIMRYTGVIEIYSDNTSVVGFMNQRYVNPEKRRLHRVMDRINIMCKQAEMYPIVNWVPGEKNRADAPSKGNFGELGPVLKTIPSLPYPLSEVLTLATDKVLWQSATKRPYICK